MHREQVETRFRALRLIGSLFKILAWIVLVLGIILSVVSLLGGLMGGALDFTRELGMGERVGVAGAALGFLTAAFTLLITLLYFLMLYAAAEIIYLQLAVEENTRQTARLLYQLFEERSETPPPQNPPPTDAGSLGVA